MPKPTEQAPMKMKLMSWIEELMELAREKKQENICFSLAEIQGKLLEDLFYLVVLGEFKRGKSTFINSLLGKDILPTAVIPLTSIITKIRYGKELGAKVYFQNNRQEEIAIGEIENYITEKGNPLNEKKVAYLEIFYPSAILESGVVLIDTPGIGSIFEHNTAETYEFIPKIDAAIFLMTVDHPLSRVEYDLLKDIKEFVPRIFFILNKIDLVPPADREESLQFTAEALQRFFKDEEGIKIYPISAKQALQAREEGDEHLLAESLMPRFEKDLNLFLERDRGNVALFSAAVKAKNNALRLKFQLQLEQRALEMPLAELEERIKRFHLLIEETRLKAADQQYIIKGEMNKLAEEFQRELNEYKEEEIYRLRKEAVREWYARHSHLPGGKLMKQWSKYLYDLLKELFQKKRQQLEDELKERVALKMSRFSAEANQLIRNFEEETASIFHLTIETINNLETLPEKEGFRFIIGTLKDFVPQDPDFFTKEKGFLFRLLPRGIAHQKILKEMNWIIFEQVDRNCGRLREDFVERLQMAFKQFEKNLTEALENVIKGVENALEQAVQKKEQAEEELGKAIRLLSQQELEVNKVVQHLDAFFNNS